MNLKTCFFSVALLAGISSHAQKNFEGTVVYTLKENNRSQATLTIEFGPKAIFATFADDKGLDKEQILILLDSLAVISMNTVDKTYRPKYYTLPGINPSAPPVINGYKTRLVPVLGRSNGLGSMKGAAMFVSDELVYELPPAMRGADELIMVSSDGRVVLGFMMGDRNTDREVSFDGAWTDADYQGVIVKATSVHAHKQDPSLFNIPADYTRAIPHEEMDYEEMAADTTVAVMDSAAYDDFPAIYTAMAELPPPPPPKKKPAKTPVKTPAKKPVKKPTTAVRREDSGLV